VSVRLHASGLGGTLYIGVTNNLVRRVYEHKLVKVTKDTTYSLVYFEEFAEIGAAIQREKQMKKWNREDQAYRRRIQWDDLSYDSSLSLLIAFAGMTTEAF
jgi:putative endonuclease